MPFAAQDRPGRLVADVGLEPRWWGGDGYAGNLWAGLRHGDPRVSPEVAVQPDTGVGLTVRSDVEALLHESPCGARPPVLSREPEP